MFNKRLLNKHSCRKSGHGVGRHGLQKELVAEENYYEKKPVSNEVTPVSTGNIYEHRNILENEVGNVGLGALGDELSCTFGYAATSRQQAEDCTPRSFQGLLRYC